MLPGFAVVYVSEKINSSFTFKGIGHNLRLHITDRDVGTNFILRKDIGVGGLENGNFSLLYGKYVKSVIKLTSWANFMSEC
jgi:hypothetical protein